MKVVSYLQDIFCTESATAFNIVIYVAPARTTSWPLIYSQRTLRIIMKFNARRSI